MHHLQKYILRKILWVMALFLSLLLMLHLMMPHIIKVQSVREGITAWAAETFSAEIAFKTIKPTLLPFPHVYATDVRVSKPGKIDVVLPRVVMTPDIWPLLRGKLKIHRLKLVRPNLILYPSFQTPTQKPLPWKQYQVANAIATIRGLSQRFETKITKGRITIMHTGKPQVEFSDLNGRFRTFNEQLRIKIETHSNWVDTLDVNANIDLKTLNSNARLRFSGLQTERIKTIRLSKMTNHLPRTIMDLDIALKSTGLNQFQTRFTAQTPAVTFVSGNRMLVAKGLMMDGHATWSAQQTNITISKLETAFPRLHLSGSFKRTTPQVAQQMPIKITLNSNQLNVAQIRKALLKLFGNHSIIRNIFKIVRSGTIPTLTLETEARHWSNQEIREKLRVVCRLKKGRIIVADNLLDLTQVNGRISIAKGQLSAHDITAHLGNTQAKNGALILGLYDGSKTFTLDTLVDADLTQLPNILKRIVKNKTLHANLDQLPKFNGRAFGRLILGDQLSDITAQIIAKSHIKTKDSTFDLVGTISDLPSAKTFIKMFGKGQLGSETMDWFIRTAGVPASYQLNTPFTINGADITWHPSEKLNFNGLFAWTDGLAASASWTTHGQDMHLKRLHIKDGHSDALISLHSRKAGKRFNTRFVGTLDKSTLDKLLKQNNLPMKSLKGQFQADFNHDAPTQTTLQGKLSVKQLDLAWKGSKPIRIKNASIHGMNRRFKIPSMLLEWANQSIHVNGTGEFSENFLELNGTLIANTLDAMKLIADINERKQTTDLVSAAPSINLPIRGKAVVEIGQLDLDTYRFIPLKANIEHQKNQTSVLITDTRLCGIQIPGRIQLSNGITKMEFTPKSDGSKLKQAGGCLTDAQHTEKLEGAVYLDGMITTTGKTNKERLSNMRGTLNLEIKQGRIYNIGSAGLLTNLLSFLSVNQYIQGEIPDLRKTDFHYHHIASQLIIKDKRLFIKDGILKSNAVNMAANGQYHLFSKELDLSMLVSPLTTVDWIVERIPIVGNILGGTLIAIPVRVKGHPSNPKITPLAPSAVGERLVGIFKRTLNTPIRIIEPLLKRKTTQEKPSRKEAWPKTP